MYLPDLESHGGDEAGKAATRNSEREDCRSKFFRRNDGISDAYDWGSMAIGSDFVLGLAKTDPRLSQEKTFGVIDSGLDADFISRTSDGPTKDSKENIGHGTHVSGTIVNNAVSAKIQMHTAFPPPTAPTDYPLDMFEEGNRQTEYALRQLDDAISKGSSHV